LTTFTFNGKSNTEFGLRVAEGKKITTSSLDVERVTVAGRDGDLLISNNRLNSAELSFPVNFVKEKGLIATEVYKISEWLNVAGYKDLTISYDPDFIYRAAYLETFSIEETMRQFGKTTINFVCYPVKFYKQGRTTQTLSNGATVNGLGNVKANPVITLVGSGDCTLTINGRKTKLRAVQNTITLDMQARQVFSGNLPAWDKVVRAPQYQMPYLDAGRNLISWDGDFTVKMAPYWGVKL
jgi:putative phage tail component, N-terminal domain protein